MRTLAVIAAMVVSGACGQADVESDQEDPAFGGEEGGIMNVVARGLTLEAPSEVPAGWTTIRFANESPMTHFVLVERLPEGRGVEAQQEEVAPVFQDGLNLLSQGQVDKALERFGDLPPWFGEIVFLGGPGLTAPNSTSEVTVYLEAGTYFLECYVKTGGVFHSYNPDPATYGMVHEFIVIDEATDVAEPVATVQLTISSEGFQIEGEVVVGEQIIGVRFEDQTVHENFVGHDVHVVRLDDGLDLGVLQEWLDWTQPSGLETPAPAPFLGGLNEMPAGSTGYFKLRLEPGRYAWVSEVPNAAAKGLLKEFTVPD